MGSPTYDAKNNGRMRKTREGESSERPNVGGNASRERPRSHNEGCPLCRQARTR